jgi:hypothetical protein
MSQTASRSTARDAGRETARDATRSTACRAALWLACVCASVACRGPAREASAVKAPDSLAAPSAETARATQAPASAKPARDDHTAPSGDLTGAATHVDAPTRPPPAAMPPASPSRPDVAEALRYDPNDPLGNLEAADVLDRGAARSGVTKLVVPPRGCAVSEEPRRVWSKPGIASVAAFGGGFVLAGYTQGGTGDQVFVVYVTGKGKLEPVATLPLTQPYPGERLASPGLSADAEQGVTVVYSDGSGTLFAQNLRVGAAYGGGAPTTLAHGVDTRFEPAVGYGKRGALIAYTLGSTPMRSMLVQLDPKGDVVATHDVTPPAMGAAAPAFVHGATPLWLVTGDPRNGLSPISRTPLDAEGKPGPAQVAAPVGMMSQPPQLAAAQADFGAFVLYTGLGSAATSAVGLVRITPKAQSPEAFVKGTAYGVLHAAAIGSKHAVLVAADAPLAPGKKPQHAIQVAMLDAEGQGPLLRVTGPSGDATHVALARGEQAGVALTFSAADGVYLTKLRCAGL